MSRVSWPAGLLAIFASIQKGSIPLLSAEDTLRLTWSSTSVFHGFPPSNAMKIAASVPELELFPRSKSQESPVGDDGTHLEHPRVLGLRTSRDSAGTHRPSKELLAPTTLGVRKAGLNVTASRSSRSSRQ